MTHDNEAYVAPKGGANIFKIRAKLIARAIISAQVVAASSQIQTLDEDLAELLFNKPYTYLTAEESDQIRIQAAEILI